MQTHTLLQPSLWRLRSAASTRRELVCPDRMLKASILGRVLPLLCSALAMQQALVLVAAGWQQPECNDRLCHVWDWESCLLHLDLLCTHQPLPRYRAYMVSSFVSHRFMKVAGRTVDAVTWQQ